VASARRQEPCRANNADGTGFTQLTFGDGTTFSFAPSFSPDGTKIIFSRFPSTGGVDLFTMNLDGTGVTKATRTASSELWPQWATAS
jgi:Tol biopolymer transport system component